MLSLPFFSLAEGYASKFALYPELESHGSLTNPGAESKRELVLRRQVEATVYGSNTSLTQACPVLPPDRNDVDSGSFEITDLHRPDRDHKSQPSSAGGESWIVVSVAENELRSLIRTSQDRYTARKLDAMTRRVG